MRTVLMRNCSSGGWSMPKVKCILPGGRAWQWRSEVHTVQLAVGEHWLAHSTTRARRAGVALHWAASDKGQACRGGPTLGCL
jgi:hypothetical protein